jgi:hypothetical protein
MTTLLVKAVAVTFIFVFAGTPIFIVYFTSIVAVLCVVSPLVISLDSPSSTAKLRPTCGMGSFSEFLVLSAVVLLNFIVVLIVVVNLNVTEGFCGVLPALETSAEASTAFCDGEI